MSYIEAISKKYPGVKFVARDKSKAKNIFNRFKNFIKFSSVKSKKTNRKIGPVFVTENIISQTARPYDYKKGDDARIEKFLSQLAARRRTMEDTAKRLTEARRRTMEDTAKRLTEARRRTMEDTAKRLTAARRRTMEDTAKRLTEAKRRTMEDNAKRLTAARTLPPVPIFYKSQPANKLQRANTTSLFGRIDMNKLRKTIAKDKLKH